MPFLSIQIALLYFMIKETAPRFIAKTPVKTAPGDCLQIRQEVPMGFTHKISPISFHPQ